MELIRGLHNLRPRHHGSVVTIGNFDGVHLGHQAILRSLHEAGARLGLPDTVMIFEPQPQEFFQGAAAPARLLHWRDKVDALAAAGVARVLCVRFNAAFRALTARQFIDELLVKGLGCRHLVIGDDFRFGCDRSGDFALLQAAGMEQGFSVEGTPTIEVDGERVSSTRIRAALKAADFTLAARLLGRPYGVSGHVVHGDKLGRTLGVPTANVRAQRQVSPLAGIYAVTVRSAVAGGKAVPGLPAYGACSVGRRPTVNGLDERFETYLLDFDGDLYGHRIHIDFHHKIRDELKFDSLDALKVAMGNDIAGTRRYFGI